MGRNAVLSADREEVGGWLVVIIVEEKVWEKRRKEEGSDVAISSRLRLTKYE